MALMNGSGSILMVNMLVISISKPNGHLKAISWQNFQSLKKLQGQSYTILMVMLPHQSSIYPYLSWFNTQSTTCNSILNNMLMFSTTLSSSTITSSHNICTSHSLKWFHTPVQRQLPKLRLLITILPNQVGIT